MADEIEVRKRRFLTLQKRLKQERQFVKHEKDQLRKLNEKVLSVSQNLYYLEWKTRKQWMNIDRLVTGKSNPSECSDTAKIIDSVIFEDGGSHLNYLDSQYGQFLLSLRENPKLVAHILDYCDTKRFQTTTRHLCRLLISTLYGSCAEKKDEMSVLVILNELMELQVLKCEDLLDFFCGKRSSDNAFASIFTIFSEMLFSSKLYLTAALHGTVMQVIVDDGIFLDVNIANVVSRIPAKVAREKFGEPHTPDAKEKMDKHMEVLHEHIVRLCKKFLKSLYDKIYCFPQCLRWAIGQLYNGMLTRMKLPPENAKALIGYMLMTYFICPAIINPEPYGINSDADISETARHNLSLVASILRSLALLECGLKDEKLKTILDRLEQGKMINYVSHLLSGGMNMTNLDEDNLQEVTRCSLLITEHDLKCLVKCLKLIQSYNVPALSSQGLDELLELLPPMPRRWMNENPSSRDIKSMPPNSSINDCTAPTLPPKHNKIKKAMSHEGNTPLGKDYIDKLKLDLSTMISSKDVVLIIPLGNEFDQHVGMLSEDKVLGRESKLPTSTSFDMDAMKNDLNNRTRCIMMDALRETVPDANLLDLSNENLDQISTSSVSSTVNDAFLSIKSKETSSKEPDPLEAMNIWSSEQSSNSGTLKANNSNVPVDSLISFGDEETSPVPKLPEKKGHYERVSTAFNDEPLIDLAINEDDAISASIPTVERQTSTSSSIGGTGGLNAILQNVSLPSPNTVNQNPWSPLENKNDPWGNIENNERSEKETPGGFENDFKISSSEKGHSPKSSHSGSVESNYAEYAERVKKSPALKKKFGIDLSSFSKDDEKTPRKKSQGAWLKDKISTIRIKTGMVAQGKASQQSDETFNGKKSPTSPRGTPKEAAQLSKEKSFSFISKNSSEQGDELEDIMEKYRKIATLGSSTPSDLETDAPLHTLPSAQMEGALIQVYEDKVVFDDDFKFEDAKRKLRTVFCTADNTNLPSDAQSFDQLLLTMLQAKLAEAINLQDRFAVAQLHETLRSIKQLPTGSCEKLIEKLESDYQDRSQYISYLIKCKQGLLSTISHLEQVTAKMQRDKVICSRYFTTLSVRLFLESLERKKDLYRFAQRFTSINLVDEKSAMLTDFLAEMNREMLKEPTWSHCTDEQLEDAQVATERALMSKIFRDAFYPNGITDTSNDRIFHQHIERLSEIITLSHPALQIPKMYQKEAPWPSAQTELLMINAYKTAADKLACIHRCCVTIMNLLSMASEKHTPGADDFLPVFVYVVLRANPPNLLSTKQYVNTFYENRLSGEEYYCWMQFCSAIEFIKTMKSPT